uniref:human immunodeficiency virus type I enhancer-binding protein 2 homolog n=1 Tax=Myxine glutinosa TaxID=7769 RepID=UPI00358E15FA
MSGITDRQALSKPDIESDEKTKNDGSQDSEWCVERTLVAASQGLEANSSSISQGFDLLLKAMEPDLSPRDCGNSAATAATPETSGTTSVTAISESSSAPRHLHWTQQARLERALRGGPRYRLRGGTVQYIYPTIPPSAIVSPTSIAIPPSSLLIRGSQSELPAELPRMYNTCGAYGTSPSRGRPVRDREGRGKKLGKYVCHYCGRACAKPSVLKKHIRSHTGERPYPCQACGFAFKTKSNLYKHRKSHAHAVRAGLASTADEGGVSGGGGPGSSSEWSESLSSERSISGDTSFSCDDGASGGATETPDNIDVASDIADDSSDTDGDSLGVPAGVTTPFINCLEGRSPSPVHAQSASHPVLIQKHDNLDEAVTVSSDGKGIVDMASVSIGSSTSSGGVPRVVVVPAISSASPTVFCMPNTSKQRVVKQKLAWMAKASNQWQLPQTTSTLLRPGQLGSKSSTDSGYFSRSESAEHPTCSSGGEIPLSYKDIVLGRNVPATSHRSSAVVQAVSRDRPIRLWPLPDKGRPDILTETIAYQNTGKKAMSTEVEFTPTTKATSRKAAILRQADVYRLPDSKIERQTKSDHTTEIVDSPASSKSEAKFLQVPGTESSGLFRSNSMPSCMVTITAPGNENENVDVGRPFRNSHSFDEHMSGMKSEALLAPNHRSLVRQGAVELIGQAMSENQSGGEQQVLERGRWGVGSIGCQESIVVSPSLERTSPSIAMEYCSSWWGTRGQRGMQYECGTCQLQYKTAEPFVTHKHYHSAKSHALQSSGSGETDSQSLSTESNPPDSPMTTERSPLVRKRRKEKSVGDDDDVTSKGSLSQPSSLLGYSEENSVCSEDQDVFERSDSQEKGIAQAIVMMQPSLPLTVEKDNLSFPSTKLTAAMGPRRGLSLESALGRHNTSGSNNEISVIQHTKSLSQPGSFERGDTMEIPIWSDNGGHLWQSTSEDSVGGGGEQGPGTEFQALRCVSGKLVRQSTIQVPEILVTEEPDLEQAAEKTEKEPDKRPEEEFQWPRRSETLAQLPAEKLPPKKKRLRLAELCNSSLESSTDSSLSGSLSRSPSLESNLSRCSSLSISLDRVELDDHPETTLEEARPRSEEAAFLTVPGTHHHHHRTHLHIKEMRRSASEQASRPQHTEAFFGEGRSKSFDHEVLLQHPPAADSPPWPGSRVTSERRRTTLVRQASLSGYHHDGSGDCGNIVSREMSWPSQTQLSRSELTKKLPLHSCPEEQPGLTETSSQSSYMLPITSMLSKTISPSSQQAAFHVHQTSVPSIAATPLNALQIQHSRFSRMSYPSALYEQLLRLQAQRLFLSQPPPTRLAALTLPIYQPFYAPASDSYKRLSSPLVSPHCISPERNPTQLGQQAMQPNVSPSLARLQFNRPQFSSPSPLRTLASFIVPVRLPSQGATGDGLKVTHVTAMHGLAVAAGGRPPSCDPAVVICRFGSTYGETMGGRYSSADIVPASLQRALLRNDAIRRPGVEMRHITQASSLPLAAMLPPTTLPPEIAPVSSKRVLSPSSSLEIVTEMQRQRHEKRAKECEGSGKDDDLDKTDDDMTRTDGEKPLVFPKGEAMSEMPRTRKPFLVRQLCTNDPAGCESPPKSQEDVCDINVTAIETSPLGFKSPADDRMSEGMPESPATMPSGQASPGDVEMKEVCTSQQSISKTLIAAQASDYSSKPRVALLQMGTPQNCTVVIAAVTELQHILLPSLHTAVATSWCFLTGRPRPFTGFIAASSVPSSSAYESWTPPRPQTASGPSLNPAGISARTALGLLRSRSRGGPSVFTQASFAPSQACAVSHSQGWKPSQVKHEVHSSVSEAAPAYSTEVVHGGDSKEWVSDAVSSATTTAASEATGKTLQPSRIKIFEGGYKSNEEYVYVRGRGRGKYVCEECGIRCKKPSMLRKHIRSHTDLRPFQCTICNFAFKTKGNLTKHMKSKAHSKKCLEMGLMPTSEEEQEGDDVEGGRAKIEGEHQFSDADDSEGERDDDEADDDDYDDEEDAESLQVVPRHSPGPQPLHPLHRPGGSFDAEVEHLTSRFRNFPYTTSSSATAMQPGGPASPACASSPGARADLCTPPRPANVPWEACSPPGGHTAPASARVPDQTAAGCCHLGPDDRCTVPPGPYEGPTSPSRLRVPRESQASPSRHYHHREIRAHSLSPYRRGCASRESSPSPSREQPLFRTHSLSPSRWSTIRMLSPSPGGQRFVEPATAQPAIAFGPLVMPSRSELQETCPGMVWCPVMVADHSKGSCNAMGTRLPQSTPMDLRGVQFIPEEAEHRNLNRQIFSHLPLHSQWPLAVVPHGGAHLSDCDRSHMRILGKTGSSGVATLKSQAIRAATGVMRHALDQSPQVTDEDMRTEDQGSPNKALSLGASECQSPDFDSGRGDPCVSLTVQASKMYTLPVDTS